MQQGAASGGNNTGIAPRHRDPPVATGGGAPPPARAPHPALPALFLLAVLAALLATGAGAWRCMAVTGSPASEAAPMPQRDAADAPAEVTAAQPAHRDTPAAAHSGQTAEARREETPPPRPTGIRLFNTIEFRGSLKNLPKWGRVLNVDRKTPGLIPGRMLGGREATWGQLVLQWRNLSIMEKLHNVNALFNQWPYRLDSEVWGVVDYWEAPREFLSKSGDCEDYAITKYFALKQIGVPASDMRIVILFDSIRRLAHAILLVYVADDAYVLDNLSNVVLSHQRYGHYVPQYSLNEEHRWVHIPVKGGFDARSMQ